MKILAAKRAAGVTPEVNLKKCVTHTPPPSCPHHQKSKTRVSVAPQKGLMSSKFFLKSFIWKSLTNEGEVHDGTGEAGVESCWSLRGVDLHFIPLWLFRGNGKLDLIPLDRIVLNLRENQM